MCGSIQPRTCIHAVTCLGARLWGGNIYGSHLPAAVRVYKYLPKELTKMNAQIGLSHLPTCLKIIFYTTNDMELDFEKYKVKPFVKKWGIKSNKTNRHDCRLRVSDFLDDLLMFKSISTPSHSKNYNTSILGIHLLKKHFKKSF